MARSLTFRTAIPGEKLRRADDLMLGLVQLIKTSCHVSSAVMLHLAIPLAVSNLVIVDLRDIRNWSKGLSS
jgi:hypothetical protein